MSFRISALERLFTTERTRRRAASTGFAVPAVHETTPLEDDGPFLITRASRPGFLPTRVRPDKTVWAGFQECAISEEDALLRLFYEALMDLSVTNGWPNRCSTVAEAMPLMGSLGFEPASLVVPLGLVQEVCGQELSAEEAGRLMAIQGHIAKVDDVQVLSGDLPEGAALLATGISLTGTYVRTDDCLAIVAHRVNRAWVLVEGHDVA